MGFKSNVSHMRLRLWQVAGTGEQVGQFPAGCFCAENVTSSALDKALWVLLMKPRSKPTPAATASTA